MNRTCKNDQSNSPDRTNRSYSTYRSYRSYPPILRNVPSAIIMALFKE